MPPADPSYADFTLPHSGPPGLPVPATAMAATAAEAATAEARDATKTTESAAGVTTNAAKPAARAAAKTAGATKAAGVAAEAAGAVVGAGATARRIERRALHRRTTNVGDMRTFRRTCGSRHARHPRCLRRRE